MTSPSTDPNPELKSEIDAVLQSIWPAPVTPTVIGRLDVSQGRGVFSRALSLQLGWPQPDLYPTSVVIKLPALGPNRRGAIASGAYEREAQAYATLLVDSPIGIPTYYGSHRYNDGAIGFVLEDLTPGRAVDQVDGINRGDALTVAHWLGRWHHQDRWTQYSDLASTIKVRRSTPSLLPGDGLAQGLTILQERWDDLLSATQIASFERLVENRQSLIQVFDRQPVSLCHGDVRADNLIFDHADNDVVFFDWQQIAVQLGEADLAWFAATSLEPPVRKRIERDLVSAYSLASGVGPDQAWDRYRIGLVLPGLAVLFLAQRDLPDQRSKRFVASSLQRIAEAIADHELS